MNLSLHDNFETMFFDMLAHPRFFDNFFYLCPVFCEDPPAPGHFRSNSWNDAYIYSLRACIMAFLLTKCLHVYMSKCVFTFYKLQLFYQTRWEAEHQAERKFCFLVKLKPVVGIFLYGSQI